MILLLLGPSAAGKSTALRELLHIDSRFRPVEVLTTRPLRVGETEKRTVSEEELAGYEAAGKLLLLNRVYGVSYGTPLWGLEELLTQSLFPVIDWPISKVHIMRGHFDGRVVSAYLEPPSLDELRRRLEGRDGVLGDRWEQAKQELVDLEAGRFEGLFDFRVRSRTDDVMAVAREIYESFIERVGDHREV